MTPTRDFEYEKRKEQAKELIAAGGCSAIKFWSNTDAIRLCPADHAEELKFEPLEATVYIMEWLDAAKKAVELIKRGIALLEPPSPLPLLVEGRESERLWDLFKQWCSVVSTHENSLSGIHVLDFVRFVLKESPYEQPSVPQLPVSDTGEKPETEADEHYCSGCGVPSSRHGTACGWPNATTGVDKDGIIRTPGHPLDGQHFSKAYGLPGYTPEPEAGEKPETKVCASCGSKNKPDNDGVFRECCFCGEEFSKPEPDAIDNQEAPGPFDLITWCAEETKYLAQRDKDFFYIGSGDLYRYLSGKGMLTEPDDTWHHKVDRMYEVICTGEDYEKELQAEISSLKEEIKDYDFLNSQQADTLQHFHEQLADKAAEIELLRKNGASLRPGISILDVLKWGNEKIDRRYQGQWVMKFHLLAFTDEKIVEEFLKDHPGRAPQQEEDLKAHAIAALHWAASNAQIAPMRDGTWMDILDRVHSSADIYEQFLTDEANNLHKPISE